MIGWPALALAGAFVLGALPFSYLLGRFRGIDLRARGSGNIGATNLARSVGWTAGIAGLLLDAAKGSAAVLLARRVPGGGDMALQSAAGLLAILGHTFTPLLRFRGGKGVATGAGVFAVLAPGALGAALGVFAAAVSLSRMVSLGSVLAAMALPAAAWMLGAEWSVVLAAILAGGLIVARHRDNLVRMARGTESRIGRGA